MIIYSPTFTGSVQITGSQTVTGDLTVQGNLTAQTFILSSSVSYFTESFASGSTRFGDSIDDTMTVTGSLRLTGSLAATGSATFKLASDRNFAIKYDTNITLSSQADAGAPESLRVYADTFRIYTATTAVGLTERLIVTNTGNVGIGVTNPATYAGGLAVSGSVTNSIARVALSVLGTGNGLHIGDDLTDAVMGPLNSGTKTHILSRAGGVFTRALTIDSAGYIGVNNSSPATRLHVVTTAGATKAYDDISKTNIMVFDNTSMAAGVGGSITFGGYKTSTTNGGNFAAIDGVKENGTAGNEAGMFRVWTANSSGIFGERMRIDSAGNVGIGTNPTLKLQVYGNTQIDNGYLQINGLLTTYGNGTHTIQDSNPNDTGSRIGLRVISGTYLAGSDSSSKMIKFESNNSTEIGYIIRNGGATISYVSSSDRRLKEDYKEFNAIDMINRIKIYDFKWKDSDYRGYGAIADELQEVIPSIVSGEKDAMYEDGKIHPQGVDYGKLTPVLLKAIQELKAEIDELKNK